MLIAAVHGRSSTPAALWMYPHNLSKGTQSTSSRTWHKQLCGSENGLTAIFQGLGTSYSMPSLLYSPKEGRGKHS